MSEVKTDDQEYKGKVNLVSSEGDKFEVETRTAAMSESLFRTMLADGDDDDEDENEQEIQRSHHRIQKQIVKYETNRQSSRKKRNQMKKQKRNKHRSFGKDRQHFQRRR